MTDPICRPRVYSTWYPWPDSPADYHWRCPLHGPRWRLPVKSCNNAIESFPTLADAVDDALLHVAYEALVKDEATELRAAVADALESEARGG